MGGRELVHGEVRRYVDPVFLKQKDFNASTVRLLRDISKDISEVKLRLDEQRNQLITTLGRITEIQW
jgi:O-antigen chain-terminating methyltransferase